MLAVLVLLLAALAWGFLGRSTTLVTAQGVLVEGDRGPTVAMAFGAGRLADLAVATGDSVDAGQVLARVDRPDQARQLENARVALDEMRTIVRDQQRDIEAEREAWDTNLAAQRDSYQVTRRVARDRIDYLSDQLAGLEVKGGDVVALDELASITLAIGERQQSIASARAALHQSEAVALERFNEMARELDMSQRELESRQRQLSALEAEHALQSEVRAPIAGRIVEIAAVPGTRVTTGQTIVSVAPRRESLQALLYVPYQHAKEVSSGMRVRVSPDAVRKQEHGSLEAEVQTVSEYPLSREALLARLPGERLVQSVARGTVHEARVQLLEADTPSGYRWTSAEGPNLELSAGTTVAAEIEVRERRPIDLIIPFVRAQLGVSP